MKVLRQRLAVRLPWLWSLIITAAGLCCVLGLGGIDYLTPGPLSFVLFYMLVVVLVGWQAGKWHAVFVSGAAATPPRSPIPGSARRPGRGRGRLVPGGPAGCPPQGAACSWLPAAAWA